ncbi:COMM domain-containing protein 8-like isoform X2 [Rhipicephalus microplus]|uniref:COMM domain-containing protein 8-like isoform X2 n=1 Tax=Rhipicephalus microplus TaxID=6941 RepID=UPI002F2B00D5
MMMSAAKLRRVLSYLDKVVSSLCAGQPLFQQCPLVWSLTEFWQSNNAWGDFLLDPDKRLLDILPATHQAVVHKVTERRREDITRQRLHKTDSIGARVWTDLNWSVKLVLGSDTVASSGLPLANLNLSLGDHTVCMELSITEVELLMASLEAAHKAVTQLRL